jgi:hypothetical protein
LSEKRFTSARAKAARPQSVRHEPKFAAAVIASTMFHAALLLTGWLGADAHVSLQ